MHFLFSLLLAAAHVLHPQFPVLTSPVYESAAAVRADLGVRTSKPSLPPVKSDQSSLGPVITAQKAVVIDDASGAILYARNEYETHPIASITKLISAMVFLNTNPDLTERVAMLASDDREGGEDFIRPGQSATLSDYIKAALLGSANNATIVLSRASGLSEAEFVAEMNSLARKLGMPDTEFVDQTGLSPGNISTARDSALLLRAVGAYEAIRSVIGTDRGTIMVYPSLSIKSIYTTNHLMGTAVYVAYGKTGYLDESLYNLATAVYVANGRLVYVVVFGSDSSETRVRDAKNLALWAERTYTWR